MYAFRIVLVKFYETTKGITDVCVCVLVDDALLRISSPTKHNPETDMVSVLKLARHGFRHGFRFKQNNPDGGDGDGDGNVVDLTIAKHTHTVQFAKNGNHATDRYYCGGMVFFPIFFVVDVVVFLVKHPTRHGFYYNRIPTGDPSARAWAHYNS